MKSYTQFVQKTYATITELYKMDIICMYRIFTEGVNEKFHSQNQEYAILRNEYAKVFVSVIQNHLELFEISDTDYQLRYLNSEKYGHESRITHSCYPKNIRRWLRGTVSRKKKCRIEFCVLVWCHAIGWSLSENKYNTDLSRCQQKLKEICMEYLPKDDILSKEISFEMLWNASKVAYKDSF